MLSQTLACKHWPARFPAHCDRWNFLIVVASQMQVLFAVELGFAVTSVLHVCFVDPYWYASAVLSRGVADVRFLATVTTACAKGLALPQARNADDVSPTGRSRRIACGSTSPLRGRTRSACVYPPPLAKWFVGKVLLHVKYV